jgi:hypothetical protein
MINSGSKSSPPFDVGMMSSTVTRALPMVFERQELGADPAQAVLVLAERSTRRRARRWSKANFVGERPIARQNAGVCGRISACPGIDDREISLAPEARLRAPPVCWERWHAAILLHRVVTSTHHILHSLEAKFDDDRQAENSSRGAISMPPNRRSLQSRLASIPGSSVGSNGLKIQTDPWAVALRACAPSTCTSPAPPGVAGSILLDELGYRLPLLPGKLPALPTPSSWSARIAELRDENGLARAPALAAQLGRRLPGKSQSPPFDGPAKRISLCRAACNRRMWAASCRPPDCRRHALG